MDSDDEYIVQYFSDEEGGIDSSDDDELLMKEFHRQSEIGKTKMIDDFEAEMRDELEQRAVDLQSLGKFEIPRKLETGARSRPAAGEGPPSDSEEGENEDDETTQASGGKADEDLFYDPKMDSKDESWVTRQRNKYQPKNRAASSKMKPLPNSDAVLNCPACFTSLCQDCQRHETYKSQYRAMFVFNCKVDKSQVMKYPVKKSSTKKLQDSQECHDGESSNAGQEMYHPVKCAACDTHVAMFDHDEVFHFFNVVTSH